MTDDDTLRAAFYAVEHDRVDLGAIDDVKIDWLAIPALIQATGSGQYDYVATSLPGLANARDAGLDLRPLAYAIGHTGGGLALYVSAQSGIRSAADLAGARLATPSFGSTGTQQAQIVLGEGYQLNVPLEGGDVTWVELDPPTILNALKQGDVDAALLWNQGGWLAEQDTGLRKITQLDDEYEKITGEFPVGAAFVGYGEDVDADPKCANEFQRILRETVAYADENHEAFAGEISAASNVPVDYVNYWWDPAHYQFGGVADEKWLAGAEAFYAAAVKQNLLPKVPDLTQITLQPAS